MFIHYFYNIAALTLFPALKRWTLILLLLTYPLFLLYLPPTGYDFPYYRNAYETVYFDPGAKLWFRSSSTLTAEPGWFTYTGMMNWITTDFRWFLVLNFAACLALFNLSFKKIGIDRDTAALMIVVMIPIMFPIIMFWSPRSSLSLALFFIGISLLHKHRTFIGLTVLLIASTLHSQYLPISAFSAAVILLPRIDAPIFNRYVIITVGLVSLAISVYFAEQIVDLLRFLPTAEILSSKLNYLESGEGGFRYSGLISLFLYPLFLAIFYKSESKKEYFNILFAFVAFSFAVNAIFFSIPHVAGRIARASDYFLFAYTLATIMRRYPLSGYGIVLLAFIVFPFMFPDLYDYRWFL